MAAAVLAPVEAARTALLPPCVELAGATGLDWELGKPPPITDGLAGTMDVM